MTGFLASLARVLIIAVALAIWILVVALVLAGARAASRADREGVRQYAELP